MKKTKKQKQVEYNEYLLFNNFCSNAEYNPQLRKYHIRVNGELLTSHDTRDLFVKYKQHLLKIKTIKK